LTPSPAIRETPATTRFTMKINFSLKIFKFSPLGLLGIAIVGLATQSARASAINSIVLNENSSTSLIVKYNGSTSGVTVDFLGHTPVGEGWKVTFPSTVSFTSVDDTGVAVLWLEPEDSSQVNVGFFHPSSNVAFFFSEHPINTNPTPVPNGTTVTGIGTDTSNGESISARFNDNGDVARAPDTGSTVGLLFLALIALLVAGRLCQVQRA
jgi:hypothetical protein